MVFMCSCTLFNSLVYQEFYVLFTELNLVIRVPKFFLHLHKTFSLYIPPLLSDRCVAKFFVHSFPLSPYLHLLGLIIKQLQINTKNFKQKTFCFNYFFSSSFLFESSNSLGVLCSWLGLRFLGAVIVSH